jgi:hypothetical protein
MSFIQKVNSNHFDYHVGDVFILCTDHVKDVCAIFYNTLYYCQHSSPFIYPGPPVQHTQTYQSKTVNIIHEVLSLSNKTDISASFF